MTGDTVRTRRPGRSADGRIIVLMLSTAAVYEARSVDAPVDVAADLLDAARVLRRDAGQTSRVIASTQARNVDVARRRKQR